MRSRHALYLTVLALAGVVGPGPVAAQDACVQLPSGAVAWWPADGSMEDLIGGHHAQDAGVTAVGFSPGRVGDAFDFDGFDTGLVVPHHADLNFGAGDAYSIVTWLRTPLPNPQDLQYTLVSKWRGTTNPYPYSVRLNAQASGAPPGTVSGFCWDTTVSAGTTTASQLADESFHHVAFVFRHPLKEVAAYADGRRDAVRSYTDPLGGLANSDNLYFGLRGAHFSATNYRGLLDEIMIFNRALGECEIKRLYEAGGAGVCRGDVDIDGVEDYLDNCPETANPAQEDLDGDGVGDDCDCASLNPAYHSVPPEVCALGVGRQGTVTKLSWPSLAQTSGSGTRYDVLRGFLDEFPVGTGPSEQCIHNDLDVLEADDSFIPAPGTGVWYLVRADTLCGDGSWGTLSSGIERAAAGCP